MRYQPLTIVIVLVAIIFIAIDSSSFLQKHIGFIGDRIKILFFDTTDAIALSYDKYLAQASAIARNEEKLQAYDKLELELLQTQNELNALSVFDTQQAFLNDARFFPARAYSYVSMGDAMRVWIYFDVSGYPSDRIFGLVQDNKALGIGVIYEHKLMGLLNGDRKSSYGVFIGDEKIPAIVHASALDSRHITADFIPSWRVIHVGDQVITSGLDGIFIEGISVGEVVSVHRDLGYISAEIKPYAQHSFGYMWLIDTAFPMQARMP